jgi:hypothetical protein
MLDLTPFDSVFWRLPSFVFFTICAALCLIYRRGHPRLARWGLLLFITAAAVRLFEISWFKAWARQAERSGLWAEDALDQIDLVVDFARLTPTVVGAALMVNVISFAKRKGKAANEL